MDAGPHAKRGFWFEAAALAHYTLLRLTETEADFELCLESAQDATLTYLGLPDRATPLRELIQCKKAESKLPGTGRVAPGSDPWPPGLWTDGQLVSMLDSPTGGASIREQLVSGVTYTALLFGRFNTKLERYVPPGLLAYGYLPDVDLFLRAFPATFEHDRDPDPQRKIGPLQVARRIRVVPMSNPWHLRTSSRQLIESAKFAVSVENALPIIDELTARVEKALRTLSHGAPADRSITSAQLRQALANGRRDRGRWREGAQLIGLAAGDHGGNKPTSADVFSQSRFWKNDYFVTAEEQLFTSRWLVITGPVCSGKSTLCRYLIFRFLQRFPANSTYYIAPSSGLDLREEIKFLSDNVDLPVLFVIDDEQNASAEVAEIARTFLSRPTSAYLLVASTLTYSRTQVNRNDHPLNEFPSLTIEDFEPEQIRELLECDLPGMTQLTTKQTDFIANVRDASNGRIGLAIVAARCFNAMPTTRADLRRFDSAEAKAAIRALLCEALQVDDEQFEDKVLPILLIASLGLNLPKTYGRQYVDKLIAIGLLSSIPTSRGERYVAGDHSFAVVLRRQYRERGVDYVRGYLRNEPAELVDICCSLSAHTPGRAILIDMMEDRSLNMAEGLRNQLDQRAAEFAFSINALTRASKDLARQLLRKAISPNGEVDLEFAALAFAEDDPYPIKSARLVLEAAGELDQILVRGIFSDVFGGRSLTAKAEDTIGTVLLNLRSGNVSLADALSFILVVRGCHVALGRELLDRFRSSQIQQEKLEALLPVSDRTVVDLVRACRPLRVLDHHEFDVFSTTHLKDADFGNAVLHLENPRAALRVMRELRHAHPRVAIDLVWSFWRYHRHWYLRLLESCSDIVDAVGLLSALGHIDRRVAAQLSRSEAPLFCKLAATSADAYRLASAIGIVHTLSPQLASEMAEQIHVANLATYLNAEQHRLQLVGRCLSIYATVLPSLSADLASRLDLPALYGRLRARAFLYSFVVLTRGVLDAKLHSPDPGSEEDITAFIEWLRANESISNLLRESLLSEFMRASLGEIAIAFSELTTAGLSMETIFALYRIPNSATMVERVCDWIRNAKDIVGIRQLVYAMLTLPDTVFAKAALVELVPIVRERQHVAARTSTRSHDRRKAPDLPRNLEIADIAEIGNVLRMAAIIDGSRALELAKEFAKHLVVHCRRDRNLGRHAVLLQGLHQASRQLCKELVSNVYGQQAEAVDLVRMIQENESIDNIIHLTQQIRQTDHGAAGRFLKLAIEVDPDRLIILTSAEANLQSVSRWLRTIHHHPGVVPNGFLQAALGLMLELREYDQRLFAAAEAATALIDVDRSMDADPFVEDILRYAKQADAIRSASALVDLCLRLKLIDNALKSRCLAEVMAVISGATLAKVLASQIEPISVAFLHWLVVHHVPELACNREHVFLAARADASAGVATPLEFVTTLLRGQDRDAIRAQVRILQLELLQEWHPWEIGLIETVWQVTSDLLADPLLDSELFWSGLTVSQRADLTKERRRTFGADATNVKFALALRSSVDQVGEGSERETIRSLARKRRADETQSVLRLMLDPDFQAHDLARFPFYLKSLLDSVAFTQQTFDWSHRVVREVHHNMFESTN